MQLDYLRRCSRPTERRSPRRFSSNDTAPTDLYTLSLHDALPILAAVAAALARGDHRGHHDLCEGGQTADADALDHAAGDEHARVLRQAGDQIGRAHV